MWIAKIFLLSFFLTQISLAQLNIKPDNSSADSAIDEEQDVQPEPQKKSNTKATQTQEDTVYVEDKEIPKNFSVSPHTWGIGSGLSFGKVLSPSALESETSPGLGFQAWGRYQLNEHLGSQFGLYQHDYSDSSFGITALKYSLLFQTGWPEGYYPFFGLGASINNVNKSSTYGKDYTQFGWQMSLGAHIPSEKLGKRVFFIPQVEFFQVFEKNNDAKAITGLAFLISLGYFFDAEDFSKNVSLINGK